MKSRIITTAFLLLQVLTCSAETLLGRVVSISDGDTITLLDSSQVQHKIRLLGIDAPEKKQPFGQSSKQSLSDLIYDKQVLVDWHKQDRYKRIVGKVLIGNRDVNLEQVERGLAWHYTKYQKEQPFEDRERYLAAQMKAQRDRMGLWVDDQVIPPWEWRPLKKRQ